MKEKWMNYAGRNFTAYFIATAITCLAGFLIVFFGKKMLAIMGLQWRNWVVMLFLALSIGSGLLFLAGIPVMLIQKTKGSWRTRLLATIVAVVLIIGIVIMSFYGIFFILFADKPESVVVWNGQKCVTSDTVGFSSTYRDWYAYRGWFVMGTESLQGKLVSPEYQKTE